MSAAPHLSRAPIWAPRFSITGESAALAARYGKFSGVNVFFARYVGYVRGDCEGLHWTDNTASRSTGVLPGPTQGAPGFFYLEQPLQHVLDGGLRFRERSRLHCEQPAYKWTGSESNQDWRGILPWHLRRRRDDLLRERQHARDNILYGYAWGRAAGGVAVGIEPRAETATRCPPIASIAWIGLRLRPISERPIRFSNNTAVATVQGWQKRIGL